MMIYDEEDLKDAKNIIGFNPKFPVNIKDDIKISQSSISLTYDSDIANNKLDYQLWTRYEKDNDFIILTSAEKNKEYDEIKDKGYYNTEYYDIEKEESVPVKVNAEKLKLGDKEVYKSREEDKSNELIQYIYFWEEDGIDYQLNFFNKSDENLDSIAQLFINSEEYK